MKQEFPHALAWGQAMFRGGRDVTNKKTSKRVQAEEPDRAPKGDDSVPENKEEEGTRALRRLPQAGRANKKTLVATGLE